LRVPASGDEIANLATTLNEMLARLQQAFERERRFVDDASHELRTPLGILKAELELALRRSRTKEELEAALASAAEESERLNRLAEDLLVLARSDRGGLPLKRMKIDLPTLVRKTVESFTGRACDNEIEITISVPPDLIVAADELRLQQALGNLLANALSHTPRGGRILVSAVIDTSRQLILSVADSGAGFSDKFVERAFDRFTRADTGRSRRAGGAGLGLAIVKSIVEAHGGQATAGNRPEGGAIVILSIPV
jgi:signal transduction histidine kinase